jgi:hypothetical protein
MAMREPSGLNASAVICTSGSVSSVNCSRHVDVL